MNADSTTDTTPDLGAPPMEVLAPRPVDVDVAARTHCGKVRTNNEDALYTSDRLLAVADGMGGHQGGEVASEIAIRILREQFDDPTPEGLLDAAHLANDEIDRGRGTESQQQVDEGQVMDHPAARPPLRRL